jgi:hypothetical protein
MSRTRADEGYTDVIDSRRLSQLMKTLPLLILGTLVLIAPRLVARQDLPVVEQEERRQAVPGDQAPLSRFEQDLQAMERYRPGYTFWQHVFTVPDGSIVFGSAADGRVLAIFPTKSNWAESARWMDASFTGMLAGRRLPATLDDRRDLVAELLEDAVGPVVHNPTRGLFVAPNARLYGGFLEEWSRIYERFGVPAEIGLAQALVESGLSGTRRSEARAVGFCQFLESNLRRLNRLAPYVIEGRNQTAQAPYCAAYLSILSAKYGSFIPALSDHHSGGTNVGRTLINGARLGGDGVRQQYFMGSQLARDLRQIDLYGFRDIYRTYGPRSYHYAEMVFGNMVNVRQLLAASDQEPIYAMRVPRTLRLADIAKRTRLSVDEVRRFNPALVRQVPTGATLYLPMYVKEYGPDVAFWRRPASAAYSSVLDEFLQLESGAERWDDRAFEPVLRDFQRRFRATNTEEGIVMAIVLAYVMDEAYTSERGAILAEFRASVDVHRLFDRAVRERDALHGPTGLACSPNSDVRLASARTTC